NTFSLFYPRSCFPPPLSSLPCAALRCKLRAASPPPLSNLQFHSGSDAFWKIGVVFALLHDMPIHWRESDRRVGGFLTRPARTPWNRDVEKLYRTCEYQAFGRKWKDFAHGSFN